MSAALEIIDYAYSHDIAMALDKGELVVQAKDENLTPDFLAKAKQYKPELLEALRNTELAKKAEPMIERACRGLKITTEQFLTLTPSRGERADIISGDIPPDSLRAYAVSYAQGIKTRRIIFYPDGRLRRHN